MSSFYVKKAPSQILRESWFQVKSIMYGCLSSSSKLFSCKRRKFIDDVNSEVFGNWELFWVTALHGKEVRVSKLIPE